MESLRFRGTSAQSIMVDVSLRHRRGLWRSVLDTRWGAPATIAGAAILVILLAGVGIHFALSAYRDRDGLLGLSTDPGRVMLAIAGERLSIPANTLRIPATRRGGPVERVELALHWPTLGGYSAEFAEDFAADLPSSAIVFASISPRESPLDATDRLDTLYTHFFSGQPVPGPAGLVGRHLTRESGYGGEIVYFATGVARPFVARCPAQSTPEVPATCIRDINFGRGLSLFYRFNLTMLGDWQSLDTRLRAFAEGSLVR
ncbi:hypothetical protein BH10PSE9_BH10PSE9_11820 [soil metagenome]